MERVNGALIEQIGECVINLDKFEAIAAMIDEEIARHAKAILEVEPEQPSPDLPND